MNNSGQENADSFDGFPITKLFFGGQMDPLILTADTNTFVRPVIDRLTSKYGILVSTQAILISRMFNIFNTAINSETAAYLALLIVCIGYEVGESIFINEKIFHKILPSLIENGMADLIAIRANPNRVLDGVQLLLNLGIILKKNEGGLGPNIWGDFLDSLDILDLP